MTLSVEKFETDKEVKNPDTSDEDKTKISFVDDRFKAMDENISFLKKNWKIYQRMIEAIYTPYKDDRSSSVVPLATALIELYVADAIKLETKYNFKAETSKHNTAARALEYVWKYDFRKNKRKQVFVDAEYIAAAFGAAVIYEGYEEYDRVQSDLKVNDDLSLDWEEVTYNERKIVTEIVDINLFRIDNTAISSIEEASDCILDVWISHEKFQNFKNNPLYKNIDKVSSIGYNNEWRGYTNEEGRHKNGEFVKIRRYWNIERDVYIEIANDTVIIREHPMISTIDGKKALPFSIRQFGKKSHSIYGRGICEACMMFNSEINNLRELLMDAIRRSNTQVLALGNGLSFDGREFSYDNEILTFDGNLGNNFQQISGNPPNQAIFNYMTQLYKDIAIYVGVDIQNIIGEPQQTAFQTEVQREASQKRINVWLTNRDMAYERWADLHKDSLLKFFPRKDAKGLYPEIESDGEKLEKGKFRKKKGKHLFQATPELLRGDIYLDVYTNITAPTINVVDRQQKLDLVNTFGNIAQGYGVAKQYGMDLEQIAPIKQVIKDLAVDYNLNTKESVSDDELEEKKNKIMQEFKTMKNNIGKPPVAPLATNEEQGGQNML